MTDRTPSHPDAPRRAPRHTSRRTIVATVGAALLTLLAGSAAIAANLGILGTTDSGAGHLSPVAHLTPAITSTTTQPKTVIFDEYVHDIPPSTSSPSRPVYGAPHYVPHYVPPAPTAAPAPTVAAAPPPTAPAEPTATAKTPSTTDDSHPSGTDD